MKIKITKETLRRTARTFLQAAVGFLATTGISVLITNDYNITKDIVLGIVGSALAAGVAAVMNLESNNEENNESEGDIDVSDQ